MTRISQPDLLPQMLEASFVDEVVICRLCASETDSIWVCPVFSYALANHHVELSLVSHHVTLLASPTQKCLYEQVSSYVDSYHVLFVDSIDFLPSCRMIESDLWWPNILGTISPELTAHLWLCNALILHLLLVVRFTFIYRVLWVVKVNLLNSWTFES